MPEEMIGVKVYEKMEICGKEKDMVQASLCNVLYVADVSVIRSVVPVAGESAGRTNVKLKKRQCNRHRDRGVP